MRVCVCAFKRAAGDAWEKGVVLDPEYVDNTTIIDLQGREVPAPVFDLHVHCDQGCLVVNR